MIKGIQKRLQEDENQSTQDDQGGQATQDARKKSISWKSIGRKAIWLLIYPVTFLLFQLSAANPQVTEEIYARRIYPVVSRFLVALFSNIPFSVAEIIIYGIVIYGLIRIAILIKNTIAAKVWREKLCFIGNTVLDFLIITGIICFLVVGTWGLNNNRLSFAQAFALPVKETPAQILEETCLKVLERTNTLSEVIKQDAAGSMVLNQSRKETLAIAESGFQHFTQYFDNLELTRSDSHALLYLENYFPTRFGRPKPVLASELMSYAGITGIYFPITAEANINIRINDAELPFTVCHELAHQMGYAREDEANFISWLVCENSSYLDFQYSGNLMAFIYLSNALAAENPDAWQALQSRCSAAVVRDLQAMNQYWAQYEGPINEVSIKVNDTFLKANRQEDGVKSYGRMIDLVIAYLNEINHDTNHETNNDININLNEN